MRGDMGQAATGRDVIQGAKNQNYKLIGSRRALGTSSGRHHKLTRG